MRYGYSVASVLFWLPLSWAFDSYIKQPNIPAGIVLFAAGIFVGHMGAKLDSMRAWR